MKNKNYSYQTVSEAMNELSKRGYTTDFSIIVEKECLVCNQTAKQLSPDEFEISSIEHKLKGLVVNAYGVYSDSLTSKIVSKLHQKK